MRKVLYITKHNPWGTGGGCSASNMYFEAFRNVFAGFEIDFCIADLISDTLIPENIKADSAINLIKVKPRGIASRILSPFTGITHRYQKISSLLLKKNNYDFCVFDHSSIAGTIVRNIPKGTKSIVIHHNYEPDYFRDNTTSGIMRSLLLPQVRKCEETAFRNCDLNIFLTKEDLEQFKSVYGTHCIGDNLISGLFETMECPIGAVGSLSQKPYTIVVTGSLNNVQNIDGIRYFINDLYPYIPAEYNVIIAGKNPEEEIQKLCAGKHNIELIANPPEMQDIILRGNMFLSPARLGGGIKVRVTDGLRAGLPVIAHSVSARGYFPYIEKGYLKIFSSPEEFRVRLQETVDNIKRGIYSSDEIATFYQQQSSMVNVVSQLKIALGI